MNCEQIREVLNDFMDGTLSAEESRAVRVHLASCAACASRLSPADRMDLLPALDDEIEPSGNFAARFHARLQERRGKRDIDKQGDSWWRWVAAWGYSWKLAVAAVVVVLVAAGIFLAGYRGGIPEAPEELNDLAIAEDLPLLQDMAVISNLDLLENFDVIEKFAEEKRGEK